MAYISNLGPENTVLYLKRKFRFKERNGFNCWPNVHVFKHRIRGIEGLKLDTVDLRDKF